MKELPIVSRILKMLPGFRSQEADIPPMMSRIVGMLVNTEETELSCDDVFALLDEFAELRAAGQDPAEHFPLVSKHLKMCGDCREEYEALLSMIGADGQLVAQGA